MRLKDEAKFKMIEDEIKWSMILHNRIPTQRELASKVGLGNSGICRYLKAMKDKGLIEGSGKVISTKETKLLAVPILDSLLDSHHIYDNAKVEDYIFISQKVYGNGEFGLVRAIDDSMSKANIYINNFLVVRRQKYADEGQIVLVRTATKYYLRRLIYDNQRKCQQLISESETLHDEVTQYEIRGVVVSLIAHFDEQITSSYMQTFETIKRR